MRKEFKNRMVVIATLSVFFILLVFKVSANTDVKEFSSSEELVSTPASTAFDSSEEQETEGDSTSPVVSPNTVDFDEESDLVE